MRRHLALALAAALGGCPALDAEIIDRVLATVEGRVIALSDVRAAIRLGLVETGETADAVEAALGRLVERQLILEEVDRYAPAEPDPTAVQRGVAAVHARFSSDDEFRTALRQSGVDETAIQHWVRNDLRIQHYLEQRFAAVVEPTTEDIEGYIRRHRTELEAEGRPLDDPAVQRAIRERVTTERRAALIAEWISGLRQRAQVTVNPLRPQ